MGFRVLNDRPAQNGWRTGVVIVAHPDDETLWCGGLLLQTPQVDWTVFSLCRRSDRDRRPKFGRVCQRYGARPIISTLNDDPVLGQLNPPRHIGRRIVRHVGDAEWDICLTHGRDGEYGHQRHRQVHAEVLRLVATHRLTCRSLWTFAYDCDAATAHCAPAAGADVLVALSEEQLAEKKRIMHEMYGYGLDSFEVRVCVSPEAFAVVRPPLAENTS